MSDKMIEELREYIGGLRRPVRISSEEDKIEAEVATTISLALDEILSRHEATEPLAVLADRKGYYSVEILPPTNDVEEWDISLCIELPDNEGSQREKWFEAPTYAAAEAAARKFLEGLEDKGGKI